MSYRCLAIILETPRELLRDDQYGDRFGGFETFDTVSMSSRTAKRSHFGETGAIRVRIGLR